MKKLFRLFTGVALFASLFAINVHAYGVEEGSNSSSADVKVGSVDTPVYSVDIRWGDFTYDWVYNSEEGTYGWQSSEINKCGRVYPAEAGASIGNSTVSWDETKYNEEVAKGNMYSDSSCTTPKTDVVYGDLFNANLYAKYDTTSNSMIEISDRSTAGRVEPSVFWNPATGFDWVTGKFSYQACSFSCVPVENQEQFDSAYMIFSDATCGQELQKPDISYQPNTYWTQAGGCYPEEVTNNVVPEDAINAGYTAEDGTVTSIYYLDFEIGVDSSKTINAPSAGDTIGSITISFAARN